MNSSMAVSREALFAATTWQLITAIHLGCCYSLFILYFPVLIVFHLWWVGFLCPLWDCLLSPKYYNVPWHLRWLPVTEVVRSKFRFYMKHNVLVLHCSCLALCIGTAGLCFSAVAITVSYFDSELQCSAVQLCSYAPRLKGETGERGCQWETGRDKERRTEQNRERQRYREYLYLLWYPYSSGDPAKSRQLYTLKKHYITFQDILYLHYNIYVYVCV